MKDNAEDPHAHRVPDEDTRVSRVIDAIMDGAAEGICDVNRCLNDAVKETSTGRELCRSCWEKREGAEPV